MGNNQDSDLRSLGQRLRQRTFSTEECFLCARSLDEYGSSSEHVFPRWLQGRFDLWNQRLTLLNGTSIPYRLLTVPCCDECNRYQLSPIETIMANAVGDGYSTVQNLGIELPYLWLGKIFYGILYKELFLALEQGDPNLGSIFSPSALSEYESLLFTLQEARGVVKTVDFSAGSVFVFRTQVPDAVQLQWDFSDNIDSQFIACRMGEVGLISVLQDGGAQQSFEEEFTDIRDISLHPIQFAELCAMFSYLSSLAQRTPKRITIEADPHQIYQLPLGGFSMKPWYSEWDPYEYAQFLSHYLGYPFDLLFKPPDSVVTYLRDESGNPRYIDFDDQPFIPRSKLP